MPKIPDGMRLRGGRQRRGAAYVYWATLRDEYVNRVLSGERLSLKAFAGEKNVPASSVYMAAQRGRWTQVVATRQARITRKANAAADVAAVQRRLKFLAVADKLEPLVHDALDLYQLWASKRTRDLQATIEAGDDEATARALVSVKDLALLIDKFKELTVVGAGLGKDARDDERGDAAAVGRDQMREIEDSIADLARFKAWQGERGGGGTVAEWFDEELAANCMQER